MQLATIINSQSIKLADKASSSCHRIVLASLLFTLLRVRMSLLFLPYYDRSFFLFSLGSFFFFLLQFVQIAAIYTLHANLNGLARLASIIYDRAQRSVFGIL